MISNPLGRPSDEKSLGVDAELGMLAAMPSRSRYVNDIPDHKMQFVAPAETHLAFILGRRGVQHMSHKPDRLLIFV